MMRSYWRRVGDTLSQSLNTIVFNGDPDESTSGRCYRCGILLGNRYWLKGMRFIDFLFNPWESEHCKNAYYYDLDRLEERAKLQRELSKQFYGK